MTIQDINNRVNSRCESVPRSTDGSRDSYYYARLFMAIGMVEAAEDIEPCPHQEADIYCTETSYEEPYSHKPEVSIRVGGREDTYKCGTPFFVQLRPDYSDIWETYITTVYENRFTDTDYLSITPKQGEIGTKYEVRAKRMKED